MVNAHRDAHSRCGPAASDALRFVLRTGTRSISLRANGVTHVPPYRSIGCASRRSARRRLLHAASRTFVSGRNVGFWLYFPFVSLATHRARTRNGSVLAAINRALPERHCSCECQLNGTYCSRFDSRQENASGASRRKARRPRRSIMVAPGKCGGGMIRLFCTEKKLEVFLFFVAKAPHHVGISRFHRHSVRRTGGPCAACALRSQRDRHRAALRLHSFDRRPRAGHRTNSTRACARHRME